MLKHTVLQFRYKNGMGVSCPKQPQSFSYMFPMAYSKRKGRVWISGNGQQKKNKNKTPLQKSIMPV